MIRQSRLHRSQEDRLAPIRWSADNLYVESVIVYCEQEINRLSRKARSKKRPPNRYNEARADILRRIHGNLRNPNPRAYNGGSSHGQIDFNTVLSEFMRNYDSVMERDAYKQALESEWDTLRAHFERCFTKPDPD